MCSILGILDIKSDVSVLRKQAIQQSKKQRHRGPDWSGVYQNDSAILVHERLAIVDVDNGAQPLLSPDKLQVLAVNGEIYNHKELKQQLDLDYEFQTKSDCEIILALYKEKGVGLLDDLNGMFAFILYDESRDNYLIARDPIGIIPLYTGYDQHGNFYVASEMKALTDVCETVTAFPPGHYLSSDEGEIKPYYKKPWKEYSAVSSNMASVQAVREALTDAIKRHLMTDVPYGVLLSGGLDSSIVAAVAKQFVEKRIEDDGKSSAWWPSLHTFAIGLEGSPDLAAAQKVADHIGSIHHNFTYSIEEGIDALHDVIYHLETYDVTTIRASTPMYLMSRKIRAMGIKMVLSGEGSDELFGGYLYFHKAPNAQAFHEETVRKVEKLHWYDCLRANKSMAAWGVEARVPFLDREFIDVAMQVNPKAKMITDGKMEKQILREAFSDLLPHDVCWRQKEQFSDGVGYGWIDSLKDLAEKQVTDEQMKNAHFRFPVNTPLTKEAYFYRDIFTQHFPSQSAAETVPGGKSVACSTSEALEWDRQFQQLADPSGRAVTTVHSDGYKLKETAA
ncbi:asparagine synthase B [Pleionea sediminis]|uniref:asparagine synthase B n=1 Tax=Pleionea sediminis TaxID=2569479 RepID=UPI0011851EE7|nr:asparagine synthase B [Pleionea sediminis]